MVPPRPLAAVLVLFGFAVLGCGDKDPATSVAEADADTDTDTDTDTDVDLCGTAGQTLPDGLVELSHDNGTPSFQIEESGWAFTGEDDLGTMRLNETVAFELEHPAQVHGFSVWWQQTGHEGADDSGEVSARLSRDFGYNGFDFWPEEHLWEGTRCHGDIEAGQDAGEWTVYAFDEPVTYDDPGLVFVTHERSGTGDKAWAFDDDFVGDGDCAVWGDCRTAVNAPDLWADSYWNGATTLLPYDYLVRLHVEYTEEQVEDDKHFQPLGDLEPGARQSWADYDHDGDPDLFTNGPLLYRNDGDGTFTDVTEESGISDLGIPGMGGTWGDYDNDGCLDLFVLTESYSAGDTLLHSNCDGTFSDATATAGITDPEEEYLCEDIEAYVHRPTTAAAWFDIDSDGLLDLYVSNMICWTDGFSYVDQVWHNEGEGIFTEWSETNGFSDKRYAGRGAAPVDADLDGDVDLLVNNYRLHQNLYFENLGDGTVEEQAYALGLAGNRDFTGGTTYYGHTIGTAWGDLDGDGDWDVVQANLAHPRYWTFSDKTQILLRHEDGTWDDIQGEWDEPAGDAGLRFQETHSVPVLLDADQDGVLDLSISAVYDGRPTDFYWGLGDGGFDLDAYGAGITVTGGWGMSAADVDLDGDLDVAAKGVLYENAVVEQGNWVQVRAVGDVDSNWAAIGATVWVEGGDGTTWLRHVNGGTGQGDQDDLVVHVGLGDETEISSITVAYPGGETVTYDGPLDANTRYWVTESGALEESWALPFTD